MGWLIIYGYLFSQKSEGDSCCTDSETISEVNLVQKFAMKSKHFNQLT